MTSKILISGIIRKCQAPRALPKGKSFHEYVGALHDSASDSRPWPFVWAWTKVISLRQGAPMKVTWEKLVVYLVQVLSCDGEEFLRNNAMQHPGFIFLSSWLLIRSARLLPFQLRFLYLGLVFNSSPKSQSSWEEKWYLSHLCVHDLVYVSKHKIFFSERYLYFITQFLLINTFIEA